MRHSTAHVPRGARSEANLSDAREGAKRAYRRAVRRAAAAEIADGLDHYLEDRELREGARPTTVTTWT